MRDWMHRLAEHYSRMRRGYPEDRLLIVFDIDGTILDMRHMIRHVLLSFDRHHGSDWFHGLTADAIDVHENQVEGFLRDWGLPASVRAEALDWYLERRWQPDAVLAAHRPYQGVMDVIRWFQIQPGTLVGLNSGRPEGLRAGTLRSLNALGQEYRVEFADELLHLNPGDWEEGVTATKVDGIRAFQAAGYRVFAVVDNEPSNIQAMAAADEDDEILFLHAQTLYESKRVRTPRTVRGSSYDITALVSERDVPQHVQLVWHGVNDADNLRHFLASPVRWAELDVREDPLGRLVLRHDSFERTPWSSTEKLLPLGDALATVSGKEKGVKLDLKEGGDVIDATLDAVERVSLADADLWFNAQIDTVGEEGFRRLAAAHPGAILQCPVGFLTPLILSAPERAKDVLEMLHDWGVNRFSIGWDDDTRQVFDRLEGWGHDVNIYAVPDLATFLQAALLLPRSLTADFNFPQWNYFGRGSGERKGYHSYRLDDGRTRGAA